MSAGHGNGRNFSDDEFGGAQVPKPTEIEFCDFLNALMDGGVTVENIMAVSTGNDIDGRPKPAGRIGRIMMMVRVQPNEYSRDVEEMKGKLAAAFGRAVEYFQNPENDWQHPDGNFPEARKLGDYEKLWEMMTENQERLGFILGLAKNNPNAFEAITSDNLVELVNTHICGGDEVIEFDFDRFRRVLEEGGFKKLNALTTDGAVELLRRGIGLDNLIAIYDATNPVQFAAITSPGAAQLVVQNHITFAALQAVYQANPAMVTALTSPLLRRRLDDGVPFAEISALFEIAGNPDRLTPAQIAALSPENRANFSNRFAINAADVLEGQNLDQMTRITAEIKAGAATKRAAGHRKSPLARMITDGRPEFDGVAGIANITADYSTDKEAYRIASNPTARPDFDSFPTRVQFYAGHWVNKLTRERAARQAAAAQGAAPQAGFAFF